MQKTDSSGRRRDFCKIVNKTVEIFSVDFILKHGWHKHLGFIFYLFVLVSLYMIWGLMVESRMTQIRKNDAVIRDLEIEFYQKNLELTGLDQQTRIESLLIENGNKKLHAPFLPPTLIQMER